MVGAIALHQTRVVIVTEYFIEAEDVAEAISDVGRDEIMHLRSLHRRGLRYGVADSPLVLLSRRRDKGGERFLSDALVRAGERLREDFEMSQLGDRKGRNWDAFLNGELQTMTNGPDAGTMASARQRVTSALRDLGPGLGDVALRCCCFLEGLESAEKDMGWSARSGKIVLRIALQRLKRHYDGLGDTAGLMG